MAIVIRSKDSNHSNIKQAVATEVVAIRTKQGTVNQPLICFARFEMQVKKDKTISTGDIVNFTAVEKPESEVNSQIELEEILASLKRKTDSRVSNNSDNLALNSIESKTGSE